MKTHRSEGDLAAFRPGWDPLDRGGGVQSPSRHSPTRLFTFEMINWFRSQFNGFELTPHLNQEIRNDFSGIPKSLSDVQYPAPGSPDFADLIRSEVKNPKLKPDDETWGLDHGTWSILKHMYPLADIPVLQLSIDMAKPPEYHFQIGQQLRRLREQGVLIVGSGNIVHNLKEIDPNPKAKPFDWAIEFDAWVKERLKLGDYASLTHEATKSPEGKLSIPSPDHWYPLLYILGSSDQHDQLRFEYEGIDHGSISMRCLSLSLTAAPIN
jgi:4,5-DOPA dioxygenase extradiol